MVATKDKNIITFMLNDDKKYLFDVNSLICYGLAGKPLKRLPKDLQYYRGNNLSIYMVTTMFQNAMPANFFRYKQIIQLADKLSSMGYEANDISYYTIERFAELVDKEKYGIIISEKRVLNYFRETVKTEISYDAFVQSLANELLKKIITIDLETREMTIIKNLMEYGYSSCEIKLIANWLSRGVGYIYNHNAYDLNRIFSRFFSKARDIDYTPTKDDFFRQFIMVNKNYDMRKEEIDNKKLHQYQTTKNLNFEDENFIVVVPTTVKEFEFEGNSQGNCVYTSYLRQVVEGCTNVVFVRKKTILKNLILLAKYEVAEFVSILLNTIIGLTMKRLIALRENIRIILIRFLIKCKIEEKGRTLHSSHFLPLSPGRSAYCTNFFIFSQKSLCILPY